MSLDVALSFIFCRFMYLGVERRQNVASRAEPQLETLKNFNEHRQSTKLCIERKGESIIMLHCFIKLFCGLFQICIVKGNKMKSTG